MPRKCSKVELICQRCNQSFLMVAWEYRRGDRGKYCSPKCRYTKQSVETRFSKYLTPKKENGCIEWGGAIRKSDGYGAFNWREAGLKAHRAAWILAHGSIPRDRFILHKCDNPRCVNVQHLSLGTALDNSTDMVSRNRQRCGERNWNSKLNTNQVVEMRLDFKAHRRKLEYYAKRYNVSITTVSETLNRKMWKQVKT